MATADIDSLQIEIAASSADAASKIDALAKSLSSLKTAAQGGGSGLSRISKQVQALVSATNGATSASSKIASLYRALQSLGSVQKASGLSSTINALRRLGSVDTSGISSEKMRSLSEALNSLGSVQKADGLNSTVNALKKLSDVSKSLADTDLDQFAKEMQQVADAVKPLADEMQKVSNGFSAFPIWIQKLIQSSNGLAASSQKSAKSFSLFGSGATRSLASLTVLGYSFGQLANTMSGWVKESNDYVENLNLFTVSMGKYADSAKAYAETVQDALGIDPSEWMRNQGIFMNMVSGFGVVEEKARLMSQNLTQLGYDISSFFNIDTEEAMLKVQSGISGELEPLRRLGYALDEATLQQVAYNAGIEMSIQDMTQAQKSQIRYLAIMQQSGNAMGDMARTVQSPANAMRILNQQITQLQRALGNLLMPALQVIIPYVQAFVEVLTEGIQALAVFFGFELPTIDYSNMDNAASSAGDIATGLDDATKAAKDLKNATLGIDELNILSQDTGAGSGAGGAGGGVDLPLELPEYDFLAGLDKDVDDLKQQLKDLLLNYVIPIGAGFAAWKVASALVPELGTLQKLLGSLMVGVGLSLLIDSIDDIIVNKKLTWENILKGAAGGAIAGGSVGLMLAKKMGLKWSKGMLIGAGVGLGLALAIEAITSQLVSGNLDVGEAVLGAIGGAFAGASLGHGILLKLGKTGASLISGTAASAIIGTGIVLSVMGIISQFTEGTNAGNAILTTLGTTLTGAGIGFLIGGPVGAVAGAIVGLVIGAVASFVISEVHVSVNAKKEDIEKRFGDLLLSSEEIQNLAEALTTTEFTLKVDAYLDQEQLLSSVYDSLNEVSTDLTKETWKLTIGADVDLENYSEIAESFIQQTQSALDEQKITYLMNIGIGFSSENVQSEMTTFVNEYFGTAQGEMQRLGEELRAEIDNALADGILSEEEAQTIANLQAEMNEIVQKMADAEYKAKITNIKLSLKGTDLTDESFKEAQKSVSAELESQLKNIEAVKLDSIQLAELKFAEDGNEQAYQEALADIEANFNNQKLELELQSVSFGLDTIKEAYQTELDSELPNFASATSTAITNAFQYAWDTDATGQSTFNLTRFLDGIQSELDQKFESELTPAMRANISDLLESMEPQIEQMEELRKQYIDAGLEVPQGLSDALTDANMLKALTGDTGALLSLIGTTISSSPEHEELMKQLADSGYNIPQELMDGMASRSDDLELAGNSVESSVLSGTQAQFEKDQKAWQDEFAQVPELADTTLGIEEGVSTIFEDKGKTIFDSLKEGAAKAWDSFLTWWDRTIKIPDIGGVDLSGGSMGQYEDLFGRSSRSLFSVQGYASGGFPEPGQLFYANEFGNPELVGTMGGRTAVANGDQIVSGIQNGVENGNMPVVAALYQLIAIAERIAEKDTTVELDGEEISNITARRTTTGYNLGLST